MTDPEVRATEYQVSVVPEDHELYETLVVTVQWRSPRWAVLRRRWCLGVDGVWDLEMIPSERSAEWIRRHRFDLDQALELAKAAAPAVTVNGRNAVEWARLGQGSVDR